MSKVTTLALVTTLSLSDADQTEISKFYDDVVRELGTEEVLTHNPTVAITAGTATYTYPTDTVRLLALLSQNTGYLTLSTVTQLKAALGHAWTDQVGDPVAWSRTFVADDSVRLTPIPVQPDTLTALTTRYITDVPSWLELPVTFEILHREYLRESNHQDVAFAAACRALAVALFQMLEIPTDWLRGGEGGKGAK